MFFSKDFFCKITFYGKTCNHWWKLERHCKSEPNPSHCLLAKVCDKKLKPEVHKISQDVVDAVNCTVEIKSIIWLEKTNKQKQALLQNVRGLAMFVRKSLASK